MCKYSSYLLGSFLVSWLFSMVVIPLVMRYCNSRGILDQPNGRKVHKSGVPRLGGVCFLPSMLLALIVALLLIDNNSSDGKVVVSMWSCMFLVSLLIIYSVGLIDDFTGIDAKIKFVVQVVVAMTLPLCGLYINNLYGLFGIHELPMYIGMPLTVFIVVFVTNAMNLIDGIDGLCGSLSLLALTGFLYYFIADGLIVYGVLIVALMGTITAFLRFNLFGDAQKRNKIFMGDAGSLTLGFILGFLLIKCSMYNPQIMAHSSLDNMIVAATLLLVPCFDVVRVVVSRITHRCGIFMADKNHLHHKLLRTGMSQHRVLAVIVLISLFYLVLNITLAYVKVNFSIIIVLDIVLWMVGNAILNMIIRRHGDKPFV